MIIRPQDFILNLRNSKLFNNFLWIFLLNILNTAIPFIIFPYITRTLGPSEYGKVVFSLSFISYFITIINYGFNLTGVIQTARLKSDNKNYSELFTNIYICKFILLVLVLPVIILVSEKIQNFYLYRNIIYIYILEIIGNLLLPTWFYQGVQRMKYITITSIIVRTIFCVSVFFFIRNSSDTYLYVFLAGFATLIVGLSSFIYAIAKFKLSIMKIRMKSIFTLLNEGFYTFISTAIISLMSQVAPFFLGLFSDSYNVGMYASILKISQVITMMYYPIGQAFFPHQSEIFARSIELGKASVRKMASVVIPIWIIISLIVTYYSKSIVNIVLGAPYTEYGYLLKYFAWLPLLSILSNIIGTQYILASGHTKQFSYAFIISGIIIVLLNYLGTWFGGIDGLVILNLVGNIIHIAILLGFAIFT